MLDMLGSERVVAWQEGKASFLFMGVGCWSVVPHLYARYGTTVTGELLARVRELEHARAAVLTDSGMQATALTFDVLMTPRAHAVIMRQVYNKTRTYLEWLAERVGGSVTVVDDGDEAALIDAIRPETVMVFAETFTNPLMRAQDPVRLGTIVREARKRAPSVELVIDSTIATPWGLKKPLLEMPGVGIVLASGTKALGGQDTDMWGYIATSNVDFANQLMDLVAMRGGILDWRRAGAILEGLDRAKEAHAERCESATRVVRFLQSHPRVSEVFHPSTADHRDAPIIAEHYARHGSLLSFRVAGADEPRTRHFCDVLATTLVVRYALSFDGYTTKVNHHKTVSEYFTPEDVLVRNGFDRLVRLAVGTEDTDDIIACLNWTLHHADSISPEAIAKWQSERKNALGLDV
jgi:methionine-gamma-lyase